MDKSNRKHVVIFLSSIFCLQLTFTATVQPARAQSTSKKEQVTTLLKGGIEKHRAGDDAAAEKQFRAALKIDSSNANAHYNLAALEEAHGETGAALNEYRQVLRYSPNDQSVISAIHELEKPSSAHSAVVERAAISGHTQQDSLLPSADAFTTLPNFPQRAPARAGINSTRLANYTPFQDLHAQSTNLAVGAEQNHTGGSMHTLRGFGMQFLRASSMMYGRPVDTCACPILRF